MCTEIIFLERNLLVVSADRVPQSLVTALQIKEPNSMKKRSKCHL